MARPSKKPAPPSCATCAYWFRAEADKPVQPADGTCQRFPPQIAYDEQFGVASIWPSTEDSDRCGEWHARLNG